MTEHQTLNMAALSISGGIFQTKTTPTLCQATRDNATACFAEGVGAGGHGGVARTGWCSLTLLATMKNMQLNTYSALWQLLCRSSTVSGDFRQKILSMVLDCSLWLWGGGGRAAVTEQAPQARRLARATDHGRPRYFLERSKTTHMKRLRFWRIEIATGNVVVLFDILDQIVRRC